MVPGISLVSRVIVLVWCIISGWWGTRTEEKGYGISCHTNVVESEVKTGNGVQVTEVYRTEAYMTEAVLDMVQATVTRTDGN